MNVEHGQAKTNTYNSFVQMLDALAGICSLYASGGMAACLLACAAVRLV